MSILDLFNRPRIVPFNPDSQPIDLGRPDVFKTRPTFPTTMAPVNTELPGVMNPRTDNPYDLDVNSLYKPEHAGIDKMNELITSMPQRNKPSLWRQIFGGIAQGLGGGPEARDQILYSPYYRDLADWQARFEPIKSLADQERGVNTANRQFAQAILADRSRQQTIDLNERKQEAKEETDRAKLEIQKQRAATYDFKARNPNLDISEDEKGFLVGVNPQTGQAQYIHDADGNRVKSGNLSDEDKLDIQFKNAKALEAIRQANRTTTENQRQAGRVALVNERQRVRQQKIEEDKKLSISADAAAWKLARQQYIADNPSHGIFWDTSGLPNETAANDDTGTYEAAMESIRQRYNTIKQRATSSNSSSNNNSNSNSGTAAPTGMVKVQGPNGETGTMPRNKLSTLPRGWKVVGE